MAAKKSMAEVAIQASGVTVEAGSQWFSGSSDGVLTWNLPSGAEHLFRALLWDEWVLDDQPGQTDCTTIRADGIDGFDLDGGSEHPRRWADGSSGEGFRPPANEVIRAWVRIDEIDSINVQTEADELEFDTADELADWLDRTCGPLEPAEAFQEWELPDFPSLGVRVISHEPDPDVVTSAAWRILMRATGLAAHLRHDALDLDLLLVPPAQHLMSVMDRRAGVSRRVIPAADPFYAAVPQSGRHFGACPGFVLPSPTYWSLAVEAAAVWGARSNSAKVPAWESARPCPVLIIEPSLDLF